MANYLLTPSKMAFISTIKRNNFIAPMIIRNTGNCKGYSSISLLPLHCRLQTKQCLQRQKFGSSIAQLHTSYRKCEIFNIQDEEDFKTRVLSSKKAIIVDFHAKWCGPCKILMPRLEKAVIASNEQVDLAKVDIDDLPDIAMEYNVGAVPSILAVKNGAVIDKFVGLKDDDQIGTFIAAALKK